MTIKLQSTMWEHSFRGAKAGDVFHLNVHGLEYSVELRAKPPRVRLLEDARAPHTECELIDEWPDAPEYWPPSSAPGYVAAVPAGARAAGPTAAPPIEPSPVAPPAAARRKRTAANQGRKSA